MKPKPPPTLGLRDYARRERERLEADVLERHNPGAPLVAAQVSVRSEVGGEEGGRRLEIRGWLLFSHTASVAR